ncbi:hypothetical protein I302_107170 [Kwoniella bestiolae CBS 10118]|uniref:Uncharacterized protein n=1 Tax=Kwoniella bestiolae CBS 10118 TaxID=1296100 RepID=A0A1B9FZA8_9TREE|nr:hypothetical protein I302_05564 [Kwoniella bestiolae CBS 10118]OCF24106.1 hypothetical protein I302_05564 [Kwoniella bestiolae CBS 10118]
MAAVRTMMSAVREEAAVLTSEMAVAARTGGLEVVERNVIMEMNPVAVRQAAEASVKEVIGGEPSLLSQHLSHLPTQTTSTTATISTTLNSLPGPSTSTISSTRTLVTQTLEADAGVTLKEVMSNALQTGVEEQMDEVTEIAKTLVEGRGTVGGMIHEGIQAGVA